ncbi:uncharacterized protein [Musca autumnalis]|uniref:uncharacterized protein n=1 Tax=Musca autumnalis TaxID=221902 RepID=UPI003CF7B604
MSTVYYFALILLLLLLVMNIKFIHGASCFKSFQLNQREVAHNISEALVEIIEKLFIAKHRRRSFNIHIKVQNPDSIYFFYDIVDDVWKLLNSHIGIILSNGVPIPLSREIQYCILLVDSTESLEFLYTNIFKHHLYIEGSYFILLYTLPSPNHYYNDLYASSEMSLNAGISHANILVYAGQNSILLFHDLPFTEFHCMANVPIIHNKYVDGKWEHNGFYVSKANNLYGCPLVCATWEDMPYFEVLPPTIANNFKKFRGLEGRMLNYISERMNFTVTMRWLNDEEINRTVYDERGVLKELFSNGSDFVMGAFHYKPTFFDDIYTPTTTYYLSSYYFVVSSNTEPYGPFVKLLLPFRNKVWLTLALMLGVGNVLVYCLAKINIQWKHLLFGRYRQWTIYNTFLISLGGGISRDPRVPFSRFLLMVWLLASFVLRTIYQGLMYHFLRHDLHIQPPKTIDQLRKQNYTILMSEIVYNEVEHLNKIHDTALVMNATEVESFPMLIEPEKYGFGKLAILTAYERFGYFKYFQRNKHDFYLIPEVLFTQRLSIYMMKNSIFLNRFNMHIKSYINEGFMHHWEEYLFSENTFSKIRKEDGPKPMGIYQLYGALDLFVICLAGCGVMLIGEIVVYRLGVWAKRYRRRRRRRQRRLQWID